ncbi:MAG: tRNA (adenosine(37)-N6)-dimethylallyltransferase MiaA [Trichlorobacter sp.]|uniref:tRNA (adenosine(37)-N6)-dimethylallyltransferase MiaA n=1 Tax=Trichlorobacter sp. TaxID=2911007 RepID=UPI00256C6380|nr:tRNA (adenosine(37)-N6)-dimethylallyltransferase MiaA [Trichlorobacter sp.]MDK9717112.1 tRNA (adenosine(37)-N6)-dimethylallyltransferase MiaA [Trichlorobacter sp.]
MKPRLLVIAGPTASGKSALALDLAEQLEGEIICVDSLTVYRGLEIGSAKPTPEQRQRIPHHLLDICEPTDPFTAADFRIAADAAIQDISSRGKRPILAGGTGLYLRSLLRGLNKAPGEDQALREVLHKRMELEGGEALLAELAKVDPDSAQRLHPNNRNRIIRALEVFQTTGISLSQFQAEHGFSDSSYHALQFCLDLPRPELYQRINDRVDAMLAAGLVAEVQGLLQSGSPPDCKPLQAIGYKEVVAYLQGDYDQTEMTRLIKRNTRHFAKRQLTWFRAEPEMQWVAYPENSATIHSAAATFFA